MNVGKYFASKLRLKSLAQGSGLTRAFVNIRIGIKAKRRSLYARCVFIWSELCMNFRVSYSVRIV